MTMSEQPIDPTQNGQPLPPDDPERKAAIVQAEDQAVPHVSVAGDTYTVLLTGEDTAQRYTLIDMHVPTGGGPPPHRHDFEEMFTVLEGEVEVSFRGTPSLVRAGQSVNVPANAPHSFRNIAASPARLLCICIPAGQEKFFLEVGTPVPDRTSLPPSSGEQNLAAQLEKARSLAPRYRTELLIP
jgi:quercetin dioxygenase-like cupin family protein